MRKIKRGQENAPASDQSPASDDEVEAPIEKPPEKTGSLTLKVGGAYLDLVVAGFLALIPVVVWGGAIAVLVNGMSKTATTSSYAPTTPMNEVVIEILAALTMLAMFVLPWLVPVLVMRGRQRKGARVDWDDDGMVEWDGPWKRNVVPWSRMEAAYFTWKESVGKAGRMIDKHAIQVFDRASDRVTTIWQDAPEESPRVRRRVLASDALRFIEVVRSHQVPMSRGVDWSLVEEPERQPLRGRALTLARCGYVGAVIGPMMAFPAPAIGIAIGMVGAALLALRAWPVLRELHLLRARECSPADRIRLTAVWIEALVRASFVVLTIFASLANGLGPHS